MTATNLQPLQRYCHKGEVDMYNKLKGKLNTNKGLSLVELIIVVGIIGFAIVASYNGFMVGLKAYSKDLDMNDIQYEVRRAATDIVEELKFATNVSSTSLNEEVLNINTIIDADKSIMDYKVSDNKLELKVRGEKNGQSYEVTREIYLNNIKLKSEISGSGVIYYDLPGSEASSEDENKSDDASLKSFSVLPKPDNWDEFTSGDTVPSVHTFEMSNDTIPNLSNIKTNDAKAKYIYTKAKTSPDNLDYSKIIITAEDGTVKIYKFYFANGSESQYEVSFNLNGGYTYVPDSITIVEGSPLGALPDIPSRWGYEFKEWNTDGNGTGTVVDENYLVNEYITAYAIWLEKHTVSFDLAGGVNNGFYDSFEVAYGNQIGNIPNPAKNGYTFDGWKDYYGNSVTSSKKVYRDMELTAQWIEEWSMDFSDAEIGDYFSKDGIDWQKISPTKILCTNVEGKGKWSSAEGISISKYEYDLIKDDNRIVSLGVKWWLSSFSRPNKYYYVSSNDEIYYTNNKNNKNNIRKYIEVDGGAEIRSGDGTLKKPYEL